MNILRDGDRTTLIDFGATMIGPYARDLWRWLGSLRNEQASRWVPQSWIDPILRAYYQRQCERLGRGWRGWSEFVEDFRHGRCLDYIGMVLAYMKNNWPRTGMFQANVSALLGDEKELSRS